MLPKKIKAILVKTYLQSPILIWLHKYLVFKFQLRKKLSSQLLLMSNDHCAQRSGANKRVLVPLIESSHYQYFQVMIIAKALQLRGAEVKVLLCGSRLDGCELKNVRDEDKMGRCLDCGLGRKHIVPMFGLDVLLLSDIISKKDKSKISELASSMIDSEKTEYNYKGINIKPAVDQSIIRYFYGAVPPFDSIQYKKTEKAHLTTAMLGIEIAQRIDNEWSPNIIFSNMEIYSAWEPYYKYFRNKNDVRLFRISLSNYNYHSVVLNPFDLFKSNERYDGYLEKRCNRNLSKSERETLQTFIDRRLDGTSDIFRDLILFEKGEVENFLHIDKEKRNIFLFANLHWDPGVLDAGKLFSDVLDFVFKTIDAVKDVGSVHLYIKTHPAEKYLSSGSLRSVADFICDKYPVIPRNVTLILPEYKINTYELFPYIDIGAVFNSTTGFEMILHDIPVVITGQAPYGRKGFAYEPETYEEYKKILIGDCGPLTVSMKDVHIFSYFYFIKSRIPWYLTERAYADDFKGFTFDSLKDILPGKDKYLDHMCNCILDPDNTVIEAWE